MRISVRSSMRLLAAVSVSACSLVGSTAGRVHITNASSDVIRRGTVRVGEAVLTLDGLAPNASRDFNFDINADAGYVVHVEFTSGKALDSEVGYVTHGLEADDAVVILQDSVDYSTRAQARPFS
jgi:hypothetical protein